MASELPCYTLLSANPDKGGDLSEQGLKKVGLRTFLLTEFLTGFYYVQVQQSLDLLHEWAFF